MTDIAIHISTIISYNPTMMTYIPTIISYTTNTSSIVLFTMIDRPTSTLIAAHQPHSLHISISYFKSTIHY